MPVIAHLRDRARSRTWDEFDRMVRRQAVLQCMAVLGDAYPSAGETHEMAALAWRRLPEVHAVRRDDSGNTTPVSALVKVTPEAELPIWGTPASTRSSLPVLSDRSTSAHRQLHVLCRGNRRCSADESDVAPTVFDDSSLATADRERPEGRKVVRAQLDGERATPTQCASTRTGWRSAPGRYGCRRNRFPAGSRARRC